MKFFEERLDAGLRSFGAKPVQQRKAPIRRSGAMLDGLLDGWASARDDGGRETEENRPSRCGGTPYHGRIGATG